MSIRAEPREIKSRTGTKDLQMVNISLRVLAKPQVLVFSATSIPTAHTLLILGREVAGDFQQARRQLSRPGAPVGRQ